MAVFLARSLGLFLNGKGIPTPDSHGEAMVDDSFYILFNAHREGIDFKLPKCPWGEVWVRTIDTNDPVPDLRDPRQIRAGDAVRVEGHAMIVLRRVE